MTFSGRRGGAGLLAIPILLLFFAAIGGALSAESRSDFQDRHQSEEQGGTGQRGQQARPGSGSGSGSGFGESQGSESGQSESPGGQLDESARGSEIIISTDSGDITIITDEDGRPIRITRNDDSVDVDPEDEVAIRLTEDGQFEVVPIDEIGPDDTLVIPTGDGFDLLRPDGSVVEFRADGENGGITATEISPEGDRTELTPNSDGSVTLSDGTRVGPIDTIDEGNLIERLLDPAAELPWTWVVAGYGLLALASMATAAYLHWRRPDDRFDVGQLASTNMPTDQFEAFLTSLLDDPDPERAIRLAFSVAEQGLGGIPVRRGDETPFEWQRRVEANQPDVGPTVGVICDLFATARFAPGRATDDDRRAMVAAVRELHYRTAEGSTPTGEAAAV